VIDPITVHHLGLVEYEDGLNLQRRFQDARKANAVGDTLMLLQHPPVLTLGRGAKDHNVLASPARLSALGVTVHETDRGGDVTYHGPGQIVGYPLLHLPPGQQDVRKYVRRIEEVMIRTCAHFGIEAHREEKWPGVWTKGNKIAALGVHLSRWYTRHGFALNVAPNLDHFQLIVPCGIREAGVTSMARELGRSITTEEVEPVIAQKFAEVFERPLVQGHAPLRTVSVALLDGRASVLVLQRTEEKGGFWQIVTGKVEPGETPAAAALREAREETGLPIERVIPLDYEHAFTIDGPILCRETAFTALARGGDVRLSEHRAFEWLSRDAALERMPFVGLKQVIEKSFSSAPFLRPAQP
jgi:lipoyl(octanoyl) transferase